MADCTLSSGRLSIDIEKGLCVTRLVDAKTSTSWLETPGRVVRPLLAVILGSQYDASRREARFNDAKFLTEDRTARAILEGDGARVEVVVRVEHDRLVFSVSVANVSADEISEVVFPRLEGLSICGTNPGFTIPANNGWWLHLPWLIADDCLTWNYPVYGSMQWVDLCCEERGIYVGCHDSLPNLKVMCAGKRSGLPFIEFRFTDLALRPGETFALPPVIVAPHDGDWRIGADMYRDWAESCMGKPDLPRWYKRSPAWSWLHMKPQMAKKPDREYADIPNEAETRAAYGVKLTQMSSWFEGGHDTYYPDYFAGPSMGGEDGLRSAMQQVHARGLRLGLYVNGRIVDPESSILAEHPNWMDWTVRGPDRESTVPMQRLHANFDMEVPESGLWDASGTVAKEYYGREFAVMCPGSPEWRKLFVERMCYLAQEYHVDGLFIDQVCGCWAYPCYAKGHGHERPGQAWSGYLKLLSELRGRLREINPEFYLSTEGVCDIFGQFFDIQQGHNDWDTQVGNKVSPLPDLYRYTFPWYTVNTGYVSENAYYYLNLAHALGSGLDICALDGIRTERRFLERVKRVMELRKRYADDLFEGRFVGRLESNNRHFLAMAHERGDRLIVTGAWAPYKASPRRPRRLAVRIPDEAADVIGAEVESGEISPVCERDDGGTWIRIPFSEIAVIEAYRGVRNEAG